MKIARFLFPNHIKAKIINDATGVALMTEVIGSRSVLIMRILEESAAKAVPKTSASRNPPIILSVEYKSDVQNLELFKSDIKVVKTLTGEAIISSESMETATASQIIIQKAMAKILYINFLCLTKIVEIFTG